MIFDKFYSSWDEENKLHFIRTLTNCLIVPILDFKINLAQVYTDSHQLQKNNNNTNNI